MAAGLGLEPSHPVLETSALANILTRSIQEIIGRRNASLNLYINIISYFLIIVKESLYISTTFPRASLFVYYILFKDFASSASIFLFAEPTAIYIIPKVFWRLRPLFTATHYEKRLRLCLGA